MGLAWKRIAACGFVIALVSLIYSTLIVKDPVVSQQRNIVSQFRSRFASANAVTTSTPTARPVKPTACPSGCIYLNQHNSNASTCVIQCTFPIALSLLPANQIKHHLLPSSLTTFQLLSPILREFITHTSLEAHPDRTDLTALRNVYLVNLDAAKFKSLNHWSWLVLVAPIYNWLLQHRSAGTDMSKLAILFPKLTAAALKQSEWNYELLSTMLIAAEGSVSASGSLERRASLHFGGELNAQPIRIILANSDTSDEFFCRTGLFYFSSVQHASALRALVLGNEHAPPRKRILFFLRGSEQSEKPTRVLLNSNALLMLASAWAREHQFEFESVHTASFTDSLSSSARLFAEADIVISVHGSHLASAIFMHSKAVLIELLPFASAPHSIAELCDQVGVRYLSVNSQFRWHARKRLRKLDIEACVHDMVCQRTAMHDDLKISPKMLVAALNKAVEI